MMSYWWCLFVALLASLWSGMHGLLSMDDSIHMNSVEKEIHGSYEDTFTIQKGNSIVYSANNKTYRLVVKEATLVYRMDHVTTCPDWSTVDNFRLSIAEGYNDIAVDKIRDNSYLIRGGFTGDNNYRGSIKSEGTNIPIFKGNWILTNDQKEACGIGSGRLSIHGHSQISAAYMMAVPNSGDRGSIVWSQHGPPVLRLVMCVQSQEEKCVERSLVNGRLVEIDLPGFNFKIKESINTSPFVINPVSARYTVTERNGDCKTTSKLTDWVAVGGFTPMAATHGSFCAVQSKCIMGSTAEREYWASPTFSDLNTDDVVTTESASSATLWSWLSTVSPFDDPNGKCWFKRKFYEDGVQETTHKSFEKFERMYPEGFAVPETVTSLSTGTSSIELTSATQYSREVTVTIKVNENTLSKAKRHYQMKWSIPECQVSFGAAISECTLNIDSEEDTIVHVYGDGISLYTDSITILKATKTYKVMIKTPGILLASETKLCIVELSVCETAEKLTYTPSSKMHTPVPIDGHNPDPSERRLNDKNGNAIVSWFKSLLGAFSGYWLNWVLLGVGIVMLVICFPLISGLMESLGLSKGKAALVVICLSVAGVMVWILIFGTVKSANAACTRANRQINCHNIRSISSGTYDNMNISISERPRIVEIAGATYMTNMQFGELSTDSVVETADLAALLESTLDIMVLEFAVIQGFASDDKSEQGLVSVGRSIPAVDWDRCDSGLIEHLLTEPEFWNVAGVVPVKTPDGPCFTLEESFTTLGSPARIPMAEVPVYFTQRPIVEYLPSDLYIEGTNGSVYRFTYIMKPSIPAGASKMRVGGSAVNGDVKGLMARYGLSKFRSGLDLIRVSDSSSSSSVTQFYGETHGVYIMDYVQALGMEHCGPTNIQEVGGRKTWTGFSHHAGWTIDCPGCKKVTGAQDVPSGVAAGNGYASSQVLDGGQVCTTVKDDVGATTKFENMVLFDKNHWLQIIRLNRVDSNTVEPPGSASFDHLGGKFLVVIAESAGTCNGEVQDPRVVVMIVPGDSQFGSEYTSKAYICWAAAIKDLSLPPTTAAPVTDPPTIPTTIPQTPQSTVHTTVTVVTTTVPSTHPSAITTTVLPTVASTVSVPAYVTTTAITTTVTATGTPTIDAKSVPVVPSLVSPKVLGYSISRPEKGTYLTWLQSPYERLNLDDIVQVFGDHHWALIELIKHQGFNVLLYQLICDQCSVADNGAHYSVQSLSPIKEAVCTSGLDTKELSDGVYPFHCTCLSTIAICKGDNVVVVKNMTCNNGNLIMTASCSGAEPNNAIIAGLATIKLSDEITKFGPSGVRITRDIPIADVSHIYVDGSAIMINKTEVVVTNNKLKILWTKHPIFVIIFMSGAVLAAVVGFIVLASLLTSLRDWELSRKSSMGQTRSFKSLFKRNWFGWWDMLRQFGKFGTRKTTKAVKTAAVHTYSVGRNTYINVKNRGKNI